MPASQAQGSEQALRFEGGANDRARVNNTLGNFGTADFTIEFWVLGSHNSTQRSYLSKRAVCTFASFWDIRGANGVISLELGRTSPNETRSARAQNLQANIWHHVAFVREGLSLRAYTDGVLTGTNTLPDDWSLSNTANLDLSGSPCVGADGTQRLVGQLDELRIWNHARTVSDIRRYMCQSLPDGLTGLLLYYPMDEGGAGTCPDDRDICDLSGNGQHAEFY